MNLRNRRADIQKQISWKQKYRQAPAIRNNKQYQNRMDSEIEKHKNDLQQLDKYIKMHE